MEQLKEEQLKNILVDVRKAYRLLYLYQRRVLDLVDWIGNHLSFSYEGGWSKFSKTSPKDGKGSLGNWAWDWLNMYLYEFSFKGLVDGQGIRFSIVIQSDTGYFDKRDTHDQRKIDAFIPADESNTRLIFIIGKDAAWKVNDFIYKYNDKLAKGYVIPSEENQGKVISKAYSLEKFIDKESTKNQVNDLVQFCKDNGIIIRKETK